jgi:micrococcal nuclease
MNSNRYFYKAEILRVVDGDTVDVLIDLGFDILHKTRLRLYGIDAPETRTKDLKEKAAGLKAKTFAIDWLDGHSTVHIQTFKDKHGKYGRVLAEIYSDEIKTACLNHDLIESGNAFEYKSKK